MSLSAAKNAELQEKMPLKLQEKITKLPVQSAESHVLCPLSRQTDVLYIAAKNKKIAAVTSTGLEGIKISDFFSKYLYPVISQYKLSFVLFEKNAWNQEKHYFIPVPGHPASEDFIRFVSYPDILTCDDIKK